jgi:hypothetical protein
MELIVPSITVTMTLLVLQFMEFLDWEPATELASGIRAIPRLLTHCKTLTTTMPVAAAYGR